MLGIEFITAAERLLEHKDSEACLRSAVSRAYYACYHEAVNVTKRLDLRSIAAAAQHERIINAFRESQDTQVRSTGNRLDQLKKARHAADYKLAHPQRLAGAKQHVITAQKLLAELSQYT